MNRSGLARIRAARSRAARSARSPVWPSITTTIRSTFCGKAASSASSFCRHPRSARQHVVDIGVDRQMRRRVEAARRRSAGEWRCVTDAARRWTKPTIRPSAAAITAHLPGEGRDQRRAVARADRGSAWSWARRTSPERFHLQDNSDDPADTLPLSFRTRVTMTTSFGMIVDSRADVRRGTWPDAPIAAAMRPPSTS